jgi:single-strand DNA-binding protein
MNKIFLIGNLAKDPELSTTASGVSVCKFSLAVNRQYENSEGVREADFFSVIVWRQQAENCNKFLKKGNKIGLLGAMQNRSYEDQSGDKRYIWEVIAENVEFLTPKGSAAGAPELPPEKGGYKPADLKPADDADLPF